MQIFIWAGKLGQRHCGFYYINQTSYYINLTNIFTYNIAFLLFGLFKETVKIDLLRGLLNRRGPALKVRYRLYSGLDLSKKIESPQLSSPKLL